MTSVLDSVNLWTVFVDYLAGNFVIAVLLIATLIFILMAVVGRMSKVSIIFYLLCFGMIMTAGYGYKWITVLVSLGIILYLYFAIRNATEG